MEIAPLNGRLVAFEGADGLGKSTQVEMLVSRLAKEDIRIAQFDFPHKDTTPIGHLIGAFLRGKFGDVSPEFLGLSFALDRYASRSKLVNCLADGDLVICDRYVSSNIAFQGAKVKDVARRSELDFLFDWVEFFLLKLPRPDLEIVLIADDEYFKDRQHLRRHSQEKRTYIHGTEDIHEEAIELQIDVNRYFRSLSPRPGLKKILIQDAAMQRRSSAEVHEEIWSALMHLHGE
jgi:dTMP kinase